MKKICISLLFILLLGVVKHPATGSGIKGDPVKPSKYLVHDADVNFWDLYYQAKSLDSQSKLAVQYNFTAYYYNFNVFAEGPFTSMNNYKYRGMPLSTIKDEEIVVTWMAGFNGQLSSDGNPENSYPNTGQNRMFSTLLGLNLYSRYISVSGGWLRGVYMLDDKYYDNTMGMYIYDDKYFNYRYDRDKEDDNLTNFNSLWKGKYVYHRLFLNFESDFKFIIIKLLQVMKLDDPTEQAYSHFSTTFKLIDDYYRIKPYYSVTNDIEGVERFGIIQFGLDQMFSITAPLSTETYPNVIKPGRFGLYGGRSYFRLDVNYTKSNREKFSDSGIDNYYFEGEVNFAGFSLFGWYNSTNGFGGALGYIFYHDRFGNLHIKIKHNPYLSLPVYESSIAPDGWAFEAGYTFDMNIF